MSELLPCPFCGGEPEIERAGSHRQSMIIACTNCGGRMESGDVAGRTKPEHYAWNRRSERLPPLEKAVVGALSSAEDVIYAVENRCMAADGPVTPTTQEITEQELRKIYRCIRKAKATLETWRKENE